jgi:uncharacterized membrane protein
MRSTARIEVHKISIRTMAKKAIKPQEEVKDEQTQPEAAPQEIQAEAVQEPEKPKEEDIQEITTLHERTIAALSYIGFLAIVPFYLKKESKFCRFHGKQGLLLAILFYFAKLLMVLNIFNDLFLILQFAIFVYMGFAALAGRWKKIPWIYDTACKLEEALSLKTKEEEEEDTKLKPDEVVEEAPAEEK